MSSKYILVCLAAGLLLSACDQSINYTGLGETKLTGKYCDAKEPQEQSCKPGDVIVTVEGRERLQCDWGWQSFMSRERSSLVRASRPPREARR